MPKSDIIKFAWDNYDGFSLKTFIAFYMKSRRTFFIYARYLTILKFDVNLRFHIEIYSLFIFKSH